MNLYNTKEQQLYSVGYNTDSAVVTERKEQMKEESTNHRKRFTFSLVVL